MTSAILAITGTAFLLLGASIAVLNWSVFYNSFIRKQRSRSWIPLLGGTLAAVGLFLLPLPSVHRFWWVTFLADWGSAPGLLHALVWHAIRWTRS